jgi:hypothetical protein
LASHLISDLVEILRTGSATVSRTKFANKIVMQGIPQMRLSKDWEPRD